MHIQESLIGLVGVGVMGGNFVLNIADHGFPVSIFDATPRKVKDFMSEKAEGRPIRPADDLPGFVKSLRKPRVVMMLVPAGKPVDAVINGISPFLEKGDLLIDAGNSHFTDTDRRTEMLAGKGLFFMGMGISGGESGARFGPSLMPGGEQEAYERVRPMLEAAAARVHGDPCVARMGKGSSGHYVKMVHNGIEYGLMQLIAETYDLMKRGLGFSNDDLHAVYSEWNGTELNAYLLEITANIFLKEDEAVPGARLIDNILDRAAQKGTGAWASLDAMTLGVPTPNIDVAVMMRNLSGRKVEREAASKGIPRIARHTTGRRRPFRIPDKKRSLCGDDRHIRSRHGSAFLRVRGPWLRSRSRSRDENMAGRLHHQGKTSGIHSRRLSVQIRPQQSSLGSTVGQRVFRQAQRPL